MAQKLITFAVPCYNSAAYMRHCVETLLSAGEQAEIILVDDGSVKDDTPAICDKYAQQYPGMLQCTPDILAAAKDINEARAAKEAEAQMEGQED